MLRGSRTLILVKGNKDYTILGIELADIKQPQIWFPGVAGILSFN